MSHADHLVIACAGVGSRLGLGLPKALLPLQGQTLIRRLLHSTRNVPRVRVVVGFMEEEVTSEVFDARPDAVIVRNAAFMTTSTLTSFAMGAEGLGAKTLFMDGDLVVEHAEFDRFRNAAARVDTIFGHCPARSDDPVYVHLGQLGSVIDRFSRTDPTSREWASVFAGDPQALFHSRAFSDQRSGSVFEFISANLPLPAAPIDVFEIDTPGDLERWNALQRQPTNAVRQDRARPARSTAAVG